MASPASAPARACASFTSHFSNEQLAASNGATKAAFSLAAVNPTVAPRRPALEKRDAPTSSRLRMMRADESPLPDLNERYRLAIAAPASAGPSLDEPAVGKVSATVDVRDALSVTTVSPKGRVVTEETLPFLGAGEVEGILFNVCQEEINRDKLLFRQIIK